MNPFDLTGPEFLALYASLALGGAALLRWSLRQPSDNFSIEDPALDTYEIAYLSGGKERAIQAALSRLVRDGVLSVEAGTGLIVGEQKQPGDAHYLERAVYEAKDEGKIPLAEARHRAEEQLGPLEDRLRAEGLLLSTDQAQLVRWLPSLLLWAVVAFGGIKVLVGLSRHRPVIFLVIACMLMGALAGLALIPRPWRSRRGDRVLKRLQERNAALQYASSRDRNGRVGGPDVALAVALFGVSTLASVAMFSSLYRILKPPAASGSAWYTAGGWYTGGSGGSSCGGGSGGGCGGGGGGGGGCGGGGGGGCGGCGGGGGS